MWEALALQQGNMHTRLSIPKRSPITKRRISHVQRVLLVASGKGGVGKSTVASEHIEAPATV